MKYSLLAVCLLATSFSYSQIYRAGEESRPVAFPHWEVAAGWSASTAEVSLKNGAASSSGAHGFYGRALYAPLHKWTFGVEGAFSFSQRIEPIVYKYTTQRLGALVKYSVTPDTNPRVYLLAGGGVTAHQFDFVDPYRDSKDAHHIVYVTLGSGLEMDVWQNVFVAAEVRAVYNKRKNLNLFYALSKRWEAEGKLLVGIRF